MSAVPVKPSTRAILNVIKDCFGIQGSEQEIFSNGEILRLMIEKTLEVAGGVKWDEHDDVGDPEFREALSVLTKMKHSMELCSDIGLADFDPVRDLFFVPPDPVRVKTILTTVVQFFKFRDRVVKTDMKEFNDDIQKILSGFDVIDSIAAANDQLDASRAEVEAKRARLDDDIRDLREEEREKEIALEQVRQQHDELEKKREEQFNHVEATKEKLAQMQKEYDEKVKQCQMYHEMIEQPPDVLSVKIDDLKRSVQQQEAEITSLRTEANSLERQKTRLQKIEKSLGTCMKLLEEYQVENSKHKEAKKGTKEKDAECAAKKDELEKANMALKNLQEREKEEKEKMREEEANRSKKQQAYTEELKRIQEEQADIDAEIAKMQNETDKLNAEIIAMHTQQEEDRDKHEKVVEHAQQVVNMIADTMELYKREILAALVRADASQ